jgi:uncharacterized protein YigE (DUF2233 family)
MKRVREYRLNKNGESYPVYEYHPDSGQVRNDIPDYQGRSWRTRSEILSIMDKMNDGVLMHVATAICDEPYEVRRKNSWNLNEEDE